MSITKDHREITNLFIERHLKLHSFYTTMDIIASTIPKIMQDLEFIDSGGNLKFAVDFSELYEFCYPSIKEDDGLTEEQNWSNFLNHQLALGFAFLSFRYPFIILPPYIAELEKVKDAISNKLLQLEPKAYIIDILKKDLFTIDSNEDKFKIIQISNSVIKGHMLTEEENKLLIEYAKHKYRELCIVLQSKASVGIQRANSLFKKERLITIQSEDWPELKPLDMKDNIREWYNRFLKEKYRERLTVSNLLDATAIEYIVRINNRLIKDNSFMLFFTRSTKVRNVLKDSGIELPEPLVKREDICCDASYFWLLAMHLGTDGEVDRIKLKASLDLAVKYKKTLYENQEKLKFFSVESMNAQPESVFDPPLETVIDKINQILHDVEKLNKEYNNLALLIGNNSRINTNRFKEYRENLNKYHSKDDLIFNAIRVVKTISTSSFTSEVIKETKQLWVELNSLEKTLDRTVKVAHKLSLPILKNIYYDSSTSSISTLIPERFGRIPYNLKVNDPALSELCNKLTQKHQNIDNDSYRQIYLELINIASQNQKNEGSLVIAYLLAMLDAEQIALEVLDDIIDTKGVSKIECLFLKSVILRKKGGEYLKEALITIRLASEINKREFGCDDPRFIKEEGVILWRLADKYKDYSESGSECVSKLHAINRTKECLDIPNLDPILHRYVINNLAYFYAISDVKEDMEQAFAYMLKLENMLKDEKMSDWPGAFLDTYAMILVNKCKVEFDGALLNKAESLCNAALLKQDIEEDGKNEIKGHLKMIRTIRRSNIKNFP